MLFEQKIEQEKKKAHIRMTNIVQYVHRIVLAIVILLLRRSESISLNRYLLLLLL